MQKSELSKKHYCDFVGSLPSNTKDPNKQYHDTQYGFYLKSDTELFQRLVWEINQAGLNWTTILNKKDNFNKVFDGFDIQKVAKYDQNKVDQLLLEKGIIRHRLKIQAAIYNANAIIGIQEEFGSFSSFLSQHKALDLPQWVKLFKKHFKFVGPQIVQEFLNSTGYLDNPHARSCSIYQKVELHNAK